MTDPIDNGGSAPRTEPPIYLLIDEEAAALAEETLRNEVVLGLSEVLKDTKQGRGRFVELLNRLDPEETAASLRNSAGGETRASRYFTKARTLALDPDRRFDLGTIDRNARRPDGQLRTHAETITERRDHLYGRRTELAGVELIESALAGLERAKIVREAVRHGSTLTVPPSVVNAYAAIGRHASAVALVPEDIPEMSTDESPERLVKLAGLGAAAAGGALGVAEVLPPSIAAFVRALAGIAGGFAAVDASRAVNQFSERSTRNRGISEAREGAGRAQADAREARDDMSAALRVLHRPMSPTRPARGRQR